jgi:hypothetical protein
LIGIGTNLAAAGIGSLAKGVRGPGVTRGGLDAGAGYGMQYQGMAATGGLMTSRGVQRFAGGGSVDNVPALLTGGEFVMNKSAVARHGVGFMHRLNRGEVPGFNTGGFVGDAIPSSGSGRGDVFNSSIEKLISSNERLRLVLEGKDKQAAPGETGSGFGSVTVNVTIHKSGEVKADVESKGSEDKKDGEEVQQGKKIGELIKNAVAETLIKESRSGGYLEQTFQRRR